MSFDSVRQFQPTSFIIPRFADKKLVEKLEALAHEGGYNVGKSSYHFLFSPQPAEFDSSGQSDAKLLQVLELETISTRRLNFEMRGSFHISISREGGQQGSLLGSNTDSLSISPGGEHKPNVLDFTKIVALARRHFEAVDVKPFMDFLDEGTKAIYQSREQEIQKLERMQENFFKNMTEFTLDQQKHLQAFQHQQEAEYAARQTKLEEQHQERLKQFEARDAEWKKKRAEIDDRENRQARRDIYKVLKQKLDDRNQTFELTVGTQNRRIIVLCITVALLLLFMAGFSYCFYKNVISDQPQTNWIAVGSQIGFAVAFIALATFLIRWSNQWFQKHADEEFKLKRLDLDIDRANWLVELAMEWENIAKSEMPGDLIDKLARNLFVMEETKSFDVHPAETLLSAIMGKAGSVNVELPGKFTLRRSELALSKKPDADRENQ